MLFLSITLSFVSEKITELFYHAKNGATRAFPFLSTERRRNWKRKAKIFKPRMPRRGRGRVEDGSAPTPAGPANAENEANASSENDVAAQDNASRPLRRLTRRGTLMRRTLIRVASAVEKLVPTHRVSDSDPDPLVQWCISQAGYKNEKELPTPFDLSSPAVVKDPYLWILLFTKGVEEKEFVTPYGSPGPFVEGLRLSLQTCYPSIAPFHLSALLNDFTTMGRIYVLLPSDTDTEKVVTLFLPSITRVKRAIMLQDAKLLPSHAAGNFIKSRTVLNPENFPKGTQEHIAKIRFYRNGRSAEESPPEESQPSREGKYKCHKCKQYVPKGVLFADHKKVCKPVSKKPETPP